MKTVFNKRTIFFLAAVFGLFHCLKALPVDQETARAIAGKFMGTDGIQLAKTYQTEKNVAAFYVFNTDNGFVIVSADDCETPIIGYSYEGRFNPNNIPIQMEDYLQDFVARIQYGIDNQIIADEITARQWACVKSVGKLNQNKTTRAVAPLLTTKWHQGCLYNNYCPLLESQPCGHAEVGCVAVAMGQIMKYWNFPEIGNGSHSYYSNIGGQLTADFGNTLYNWEIMPDALNETSSNDEIDAVATLLFHCGVSVNMNYTSNGSGAQGTDVPNVLKYYFKYSDELHRETAGTDMGLWLNNVKACLDKERPLFYIGRNVESHAFVCDGYDDNDLLHFNWGWGGNGDGYFALGNLNPLGHDFSKSNSAIFDITPDNVLHLVSATAYPLNGGSIEGNGLYLSHQQCTLTAVSAENYEFFYWKRDGRIVSYDTVYSLFALEDIDNIEAVFSLNSIANISANVSHDNVNITWSIQSNHEWPLLKQFQYEDAVGIASDGNYIYLSKYDNKPNIWKYTMDGVFVENFLLNGSYRPTEITYDGNCFYYNGDNSAYLFAVDLPNHTVLSNLRTGYTPICSYDSVRNGIWIAKYNSPQDAYRLQLINQMGANMQNGPIMPSGFVPNGSGFFVSKDGDSHLFIKTEEGGVYDYDIEHDLFIDVSFKELGTSYGAFVGGYEGRDAMFVSCGDSVKIFEIRYLLWPITQYHLFRSDHEGNITLLNSDVVETMFIDPSWEELGTGLYRYGISVLYDNGNESKIMWSNPIPKGNYGLEENTDSMALGVQKRFENGRIVIVKDGKRYNVTGQVIR